MKAMGTLGNDSSEESHVPVPVHGLETGVTAICAGSFDTCAVANGNAYCWGQNWDGQLARDKTATPSSNVPLKIDFP